MQFGVCTGTAMAATLAAAGFDYIELNVQGDLCPESDEAAFAEKLRQIEASALPCLAANCFVPGHLKITGPQANMQALTSYVTTACERAQRAGVRKIVFGSGGARQVPDGFAGDQAYEQLVAFGKMAGPVAAGHDVEIVVEPLNVGECNVFTSVGECARYVRDVALPAVRLLADAYHVAKDNDRLEDIADNGDILRHLHIATCENRYAPGLEENDFSGFFAALKQAGYSGTLSIEGRWNDLPAEAPRALEVLRQCTAAAGL